ncbi:hypothetical protein BN1723_020426 [Verticillium longisporum]|uniref:Uncharacterized protein n=1 Tax=Verticillium longisporum TaxID=100787 RepID=A0A0G4NN57_VERLO|nr:hypothetical protein BN1723_020426 [Verticillium longisporum]
MTLGWRNVSLASSPSWSMMGLMEKTTSTPTRTLTNTRRARPSVSCA